MEYKITGEKSPTVYYFSQSRGLGEGREGMTVGIH